MLITWKGDTNGLDLRPTWKVESVQVHLVENFRNSGRDTFVLYVRATKEQTQRLQEEYGDSISVGVLGLEVLPLIPGKSIWTWNGFRLTQNYTAFEVTP